MTPTPILLEVSPSDENIQVPEEGDVEEWVAVSGGGFVTHDMWFRSAVQRVKHVNLELGKPGATIKKKSKKTTVARIYFEDGHCSSTKCNLKKGHSGLCSHLAVSGKRSTRQKGSYTLTTASMDDLQMRLDDL